MTGILLSLIFIRPFISSAAWPCADAVYSFLLLGVILLGIARTGISIQPIRSLRYPLLLFVASIIVSIIYAQNKQASISALYTHVQGIFVFVVVASLPLKDKERTIRVLLATGIIVSLAALYQYFFGFRVLSEFMQERNIQDSFALDYIARRRPFLPFVTPNALAGYLAMIVPLSFFSRRAWWVLIPLSCALVLTKSIGAFISLAVGLSVFFYFNRNSRKWFMVYLTGLVVCVGYVFLTRIHMQGTHTQPLFSAVMRLDYWRETIAIIKAHPLSGVGIGNFNLIHSRYAHNVYLQTWAEMGIAGIASLLWLVAGIWNTGLTVVRGASQSRTLALLAATSVFLVHNLIDFTFFLPEVNVIWWVILGLALERSDAQ